MDEQILRETAAILVFAELAPEAWDRLTDEEGAALLESKMEYLCKLTEGR